MVIMRGSNVFSLGEFGFSEIEDASDSVTDAEDRLFDLLEENPEIINCFSPTTGFAPLDKYTPDVKFDRDFFVNNQDVAFRMSVSGKDVDAIQSELRSAMDAISNAHENQ